MKKLLECLNKKGLLSVHGMTTELGYKTMRRRLKGLKQCEDWLRNKPQNSIECIFENKTISFK